MLSIIQYAINYLYADEDCLNNDLKLKQKQLRIDRLFLVKQFPLESDKGFP